MNSARRAAACLAVAMGTAAATPAESPATAPAPPQATIAELAAQDKALVDGGLEWVRRVLMVPATPDVDPALHDALARMVDEHLARMRTLLPRWIATERARAAAPLTQPALSRAMGDRLMNEIALWRLESPGAAYDAVLTRALLKPALCDMPARESYLGVLVTAMQAAPAKDRATLLAGERELLSHWGQARVGLPARPVHSLADDETALIARLAAGDATPEVPMPPVLANAAFKGELSSPTSDVTCALHQWGLAQALRLPGTTATALAAWRYATLRTVDDWSSPTRDDATHQAWDYPRAAAANGVSGEIRVEVTQDAQGHYVSGRVLERHLEVPGVGSDPPVAFETIFDRASLARAPREVKLSPPSADGTPPKPITLAVRWTLQ